MHHRLEPRGYHRECRVEFNPARLLVLREAELRIDRQIGEEKDSQLGELTEVLQAIL